MPWLLVLLLCAPAVAEKAPLKAPKDWVLKGGLPASPTRLNDSFPLSDQKNLGRWKRYDTMWDEFSGTELDGKRWHPTNPGWKGRQPGFFSRDNVKVADGELRLVARLEEPPEGLGAEGYKTYSTAAVQSVRAVLYGYFEIRAKAMRSAASSAFWFYKSDEKRWTEIDVFELQGALPEPGSGPQWTPQGVTGKYNMNAHVFRVPNPADDWSVGGIWDMDFDPAEAFHVYGLEWDRKWLKWFVDGVMVRRLANNYWTQALTLNFDSETMPGWMGLPRAADLPSTFSVDYVRAWKKGR